MRHEQRTVHGVTPSDAARLYEQYSARILAYCQHVLRDPEDAEDAVQTTFLYAHRALERGVSPDHEYAWLRAIAKNACRVLQRTAARRGFVTGLDLDLVPAPEQGDGDQQELVADLGRALAALPEGQRRALVMREWQGLSAREIASRLGLSAPATHALLTRARRSLARAMTATGPRRALGLDFGAAFLKLKALFAGSAAKAAATTVVVAGVAVGAATVERAVVDRGGPAWGGTKLPAPSARTSRSDQVQRIDGRSRVGVLPPSRETSEAAAEAVRAPGTTGRNEAIVRPPASAAPTMPTASLPGGPGRTASATNDTTDEPTNVVSEAVSGVSDLADSLAEDAIGQIPDAGLDLPPLLSDPPLLEEDDQHEEDPLGDVLPDPPLLPGSPLP